MKVFKYLLIICLLIGVALCVYVATISSYVKYSKSITIATNKDVATQLILNLPEWDSWLQANKNYKEFTYNKGTNEIAWMESNDNYLLQSTGKNSTDSIAQTVFINNTDYILKWNIKENESVKNQVEVTLTTANEMTFKEKFNNLFSKSANAEIEQFINDKLQQLQHYITNDLEAYNFVYNGAVKFQAENYIQYKDTCSSSEFDARIESIKLKLDKFIKEFGIISVGKPFILYQPNLPKGEKIAFAYCLPVDDEILSSPGSEIEGGFHDEFLAFKTTLTGNPKRRFESWEKTRDSLVNTDFLQAPTSFFIEVIDTETKAVGKKKTEFYIPLVTKKTIAKPTTSAIKVVKDTLN